MHMEMTTLQLLVGQPRIFATEHQRHFAPRLHLLDRGLAALARIEQRPGNAAIARTGAEHQAAAHQGFFQGPDHLGTCQDVIGAGGTRLRFDAGEVLRVDQHQPRQAHVLHGAGGTTDIAGMTGIDQHHANVLQQRFVSQPNLKGAKYYRRPRLNATNRTASPA
ncbi:hypothetical protein D3C85_1008560 [compost metagenome]